MITLRRECPEAMSPYQASHKYAELYLPDLGTEDQEFLSVNYDFAVPVPRPEDKEELESVLKKALTEEYIQLEA